MRRILKALGLKEVFAYGKHRTVLRKSRLTLCIDETEAGNFLELEGERHEIVKFARALKVRRTEFVTRSYIELLAGREQEGGPD